MLNLICFYSFSIHLGHASYNVLLWERGRSCLREVEYQGELEPYQGVNASTTDNQEQGDVNPMILKSAISHFEQSVEEKDVEETQGTM